MAKHSGPVLPLPGLRWRGLTLQVFVFAILPLILLVVGGVVLSQSLHHQAMVNLVAERNLRAVLTAADSISQQLDTRVRSLQTAASLIEGGTDLDEPGSGLDATRTYFDSGLVLYDPTGAPVRSEEIGWAENLPKDLANFWEQLSTNQSGQVVLATIPDSPSSVIVLAGLRLKNDNILVGGFSPAVLIRRMGQFVVTNEHSHLLVISSAADVVYFSGDAAVLGELSAHPGAAEALRGESGVNTLPGGGHGDQVTAFSFIPETRWGLVLTENWEEISTPFLSTTQSAPLILIPILILALAALWFGARQIVKPLQDLEERTMRLARGDFDAVREPVGGIAEIKALQGALTDTAGDLRSAQEALRSYIGSITEGVESERRSLARELHDDTLQALIALNQRVQLALEAADTEEERNSLNELLTMASQTIQNLRRMVRGLRPIYLDDLGLTAALEMLVKEAPSAPGQSKQFTTNGISRRLEPDVELALYRITQEALTNALKHAKADRISVMLDFQTAGVQLIVEDNGRGFDLPDSTDEFARHGHFGLLGMSERVELIGATLHVISRPGEGTRVSVVYAPAESLPDQP